MKLLKGDCLELIKTIDNDSVDLVVTSPPYNVDLGNNKHKKVGYNSYEDNLPYHEYIEWLKGLFDDIYTKLKSGGRVVINIGPAKNGRIPTHSDIIQFMNDIGYLNLTQIIWQKNQVGSRTAWGSFCSPSCPSFPTPYEYILVFAKDTLKLQESGETDLTKEEFIEWSLAFWSFNAETQMKKFDHPAMFPEELPKRCIKMLSYVGATVLDPFMGAGTTGVVCKKYNRHFIGFEMDEKYFNTAKKRIDNIQTDLFASPKAI